MLSAALDLFLLRKLPFERFAFPRYLSVLAITLFGLFHSFTNESLWLHAHSRLPKLTFEWFILISFGCLWTIFLLQLAILRWWMRRGHRWDGQGDLLNLLVASDVLGDILFIGLGIFEVDWEFGVNWLIPVLLNLYLFWVKANALSGAIPKATLSYSFIGSVISLILAYIGSILLLGSLMIVVKVTVDGVAAM